MMKTVDRRLFLFLVIDWLFPWWRRHVTLAGIRFRRIREGRSSRRYLFIHGNEATARQVLQEHVRDRPGAAYLVTGDERNVRIKGALIDPNRLFSREGAERSLTRLNPGADPAKLAEVLDYLDRDRTKLLRALLPPDGGLLIVVHNNNEGYSIRDEVAISNQVSLKKPDEPHEFFLCTDPADFARIAAGPYNAVLQNIPSGQEDGSLSRLAARQKLRYVNLEVALGKTDLQREMLAWLDRTLP
jgi:hypothetical protein